MNKTDWTDKLRDRLENYEAPVGDDLWADIEQSLVRRPAVLRPLDAKPARRIGLRWWGMAAALAALVAGGCYVYLQKPLSRPSSAVGNQIITSFGTNVSRSAANSRKPVLLAQAAVGSNRAGRMSQGIGASAPVCLSADGDVDAVCDLSPAAMEPSGSSVRSVPETSARESSKAEYSKQNSSVRPSSAGSYSTVDPHVVAAKSGASDGWSLKLYAENGIPRGLGDGKSSGSLVMSDGMMGSSVDNSLQFMAVKINSRETLVDSKHHFPVSVGLQVGVPLLPRLSLTTGVVYTQTSSDFTYQHGSSQTVVNQSLHYVGIPVGLTYEVWGISRLRTYVNVGGEGAVNVKNKTMLDGYRTDVDRDKMQWSANASLGVQFDVVPQLGIYAEPGAKYYFDNGSNVDNVFKDKKLNFNFSFGLRWNIGK